jgi:uncharacterized membrane protein
MTLVDIIIGALDVQMMGERDSKKRGKIFLVILGIGLVVVIFDPF